MIYCSAEMTYEHALYNNANIYTSGSAFMNIYIYIYAYTQATLKNYTFGKTSRIIFLETHQGWYFWKSLHEKHSCLCIHTYLSLYMYIYNIYIYICMDCVQIVFICGNAATQQMFRSCTYPTKSEHATCSDIVWSEHDLNMTHAQTMFRHNPIWTCNMFRSCLIWTWSEHATCSDHVQIKQDLNMLHVQM